ncbi:sodium-dependent phosphate transport protein 2B [Lingula anatina]|uniref:Sodium-dependent phosphate transport protein 2B n=1 Tax=Lingula anatina TaxID=7574 RepID=A0A1S3HU49_LINAN|nr:sodium-dependent phosphate transport protein 2B [Lingula anatina]|eukprot:XP_013389066.1 sodium-dependent phosphate transport protein 2B [Lingula anatina]
MPTKKGFNVSVPVDENQTASPADYGSGQTGESQVDLTTAEGKEHQDEEPFDPWALPELKDSGPPWSELSGAQKIQRVLISLLKAIGLVALLLLFICSLDLLGSSFQLIGGRAAGTVFSEDSILGNDVAGLMIGVLGTVLVQSSSTSTSIIVTMVASNIISVPTAIPMIMGANIGTSVTNTIVAMGQSADRNEFRRAFAGATVHDMFNWLCVLVLLPVEAVSGYMYRLTDLLINSMPLVTTGAKIDFFKLVTSPFTGLLIKLDKNVIIAIAAGDTEKASEPLQLEWCKTKTVLYNETTHMNFTIPLAQSDNATWLNYVKGLIGNNTFYNESSPAGVSYKWNQTTLEEKSVGVSRCTYLFSYFNLDETVAGIVLLIIAILILCVCLALIVKLLHSVLKGSIARIIKKVLNADFPGKLAFLTGYVALLVGAGMTIAVQSSSIFTSAMTPLVGIGVISIERMYPLTLGANIGTTCTGLIAALASSGSKFESGLQIAFVHLFFNISGILIFYPIPFMRVPIKMAKTLGNTTAKYRWFALFYLITMYFILPLAVFGLSLAGLWVMVGVGGTFLLLFLLIILINVCQRKCSRCLPRKLRTWDWLPLWLHSLQPYDRAISKLLCCKRCKSKEPKPTEKQNGHANKAFEEEHKV